MDGTGDEQVVTSYKVCFFFQNTMSRLDIFPLLKRILMTTTMFAMIAITPTMGMMRMAIIMIRMKIMLYSALRNTLKNSA